MNLRRVSFRATWIVSLLLSLLCIVSVSSQSSPITLDPDLTLFPAPVENLYRDYPAQFSPDGKTILFGNNQQLTLWDAETGDVLRTYEGSFRSMAFSPDGQMIVTAAADNIAIVWDVASGGQLLTLTGHRDHVNDALFSPDGQTIATISSDNTAILWDVQTGERLFTLTGHARLTHRVAFSPDGQTLLTGSGDHTARLWTVRNGRRFHTLEADLLAYSLGFSPDSQTAVITGPLKIGNVQFSAAVLWDAQTGEVLHTLDTKFGHVEHTAFSPDGLRLLTGSKDDIVTLWDAQTGEVIYTFYDHSHEDTPPFKKSISGVAFSPDGAYIVTSGQDSNTFLWDAQTLEKRYLLHASDESVIGFDLSPDGKRIVVTYQDRMVSLWQMPDP